MSENNLRNDLRAMPPGRKKHIKRYDLFIQAGNNIIETVPNE